uniref:Uncharacterized protein n=1 Tax=OCS116 cluster bacterium TaxID=2030921 RepID=A0A2A4YTE0_9PROT
MYFVLVAGVGFEPTALGYEPSATKKAPITEILIQKIFINNGYFDNLASDIKDLIYTLPINLT